MYVQALSVRLQLSDGVGDGRKREGEREAVGDAPIQARGDAKGVRGREDGRWERR